MKTNRIQNFLSNDVSAGLFGSMRQDMGSIMNKHLAVYRDKKGMEEALEQIKSLKEDYFKIGVHDKSKTFNTNLLFTLELGGMIDCAEAICISALEREESRGAHTRTDFPDRDDENWLKHILVKQTSEGPITEEAPVKITNWEPQIRSY